jgi:HEAT repeat protein
VRGIVAVACSIVLLVAVGLWYYNPARVHKAPPATEALQDPNAWLDKLHSQNPHESSEATRYVEQLGARALPAIHATLQDPAAEPQRVKAALKACGMLGAAAAPAIAEVADAMLDPTLTTEAAVALSFMGPGAFAPLRESLGSDDPVVRRESLRSIGKLKERAPLEARAVLPLLISGTGDADPGVRAVAATYLGIIHEGGAESVVALIEGLKDPEPAVRRAAATALGSFGADAVPALPALRKAAGDPDEDVAREAGVSLVKLRTGS